VVPETESHAEPVDEVVSALAEKHPPACYPLAACVCPIAGRRKGSARLLLRVS
jgi:hypothetical protein